MVQFERIGNIDVTFCIDNQEIIKNLLDPILVKNICIV